MNSLIIVCVAVSLLVMMVVLAPFFFGAGGALQEASASYDLADLTSRQSAILQRWLRDESAAKSGEISPTEWNQRQRYLTSRYVDLARRIAWLESQPSSGEITPGGAS